MSNNAIALKLNVRKQYVSKALKSAEAKMAIIDAQSRSVDSDEMQLDSRGQPIAVDGHIDSDRDRARELDSDVDVDRDRRRATDHRVIKKRIKEKE